MLRLTQQYDDPSGIVSKLIFEDEDVIAETVAYKYQDRGVVCFSVQSGCEVGCSFCGTGKNFIGNLSTDDMFVQIDAALKVIGQKEKIQIMAMSMGEPMLNWPATKNIAEYYLNIKRMQFFVSTIGLNDPYTINDFLLMGRIHSGFGLQFSLHEASEYRRLELFRNKELDYLSIKNMLFIGRMFNAASGNKTYFNYIVMKEQLRHEALVDAQWLANNLKGMHLTCSVLCNTKDKKKADVQPALDMANMVRDMSEGAVETSTFDPSGQDTIGGGCGQLHYVQEKMKELKKCKD